MQRRDAVQRPSGQRGCAGGCDLRLLSVNLSPLTTTLVKGF